MNDPSISDRVRTAKQLLEEGGDEYHCLSAGCQAHLQEAIEFLTQVDESIRRSEQKSSEGEPANHSDTDDWPTFELVYTFTPDVGGNRFRFEPDEVVIYDPTRTDTEEGRWLSAKRDAYLPTKELR